MYWPVDNDDKYRLPINGEPGSFLEDRTDRIHCGIDIYAERGANVYAIEKGMVNEVSVFTSPDIVSYWFKTYQIIMKADSGLYYRYAELETSIVSSGKRVHEGDVIGLVGQVLNPLLIFYDNPEYIRQLKIMEKMSMLHLETYTTESVGSKEYLGGNCFDRKIPQGLINPCSILHSIVR